MKSKKYVPLTFEYRLFEGSHVPSIDLNKIQCQTPNEGSSIFTKTTKLIMLYELVEVSNALQALITKSGN